MDDQEQRPPKLREGVIMKEVDLLEVPKPEGICIKWSAVSVFLLYIPAGLGITVAKWLWSSSP